MKTYLVSEMRTTRVTVLIEADSEEDAIDRFFDGDFNETGLREEVTDSFGLRADAVAKADATP